MRNEPKPLSQPGAMRAYRLRDKLAECQDNGTLVHMNYVKRNGERGAVRNAEVRFFTGRDGMDTMSVTVRDPEKGDRTLNLCRVARAWPAR